MTAEVALNDGVYSLTAEAIPGLTEQIAGNLAILGFPVTARQQLEDFFKALHGEPSVAAIALVSAATKISADLDFHVLLGTPADLQSREEEIGRIGGHHNSFALALRGAAGIDYYGTELYMVHMSSAEEFQDNLVHRFGIGSSSGVLLVATIMRP